MDVFLRIATVTFLFPAFALAADAKTLTKELEAKVRSSGIPLSELSLYITTSEGEAPEEILDVNAGKTMIPASVSKVLTSSAVLAAFPPGTKFKTGLWTDGPVKDGVLKGNLYLKGGGDPSFVSENMWVLVNTFARTGIRKIDGDIIVDDSLFDKVRFDDSREDVRVDRAYDAPVGAMSFNWNSINVFVRPGENGEPGRVFLDPDNGYTKLVNKTKTVRGVVNTIAVDRDGGAVGDTVIVSGHIGQDKPEVVIYKNITKPDLWAGENLRSFLRQRGITVDGKVKNGIVPQSASVAAESDSKPIELILADMDKFSNNYVAEMLTKNIASLDQKPATLAHGVEKIGEHLTKDVGLEAKDFIFKNPSGLTRDNRLSARVLWRVLRHLRTDFRVQPEFLTAIPIAGIDGTLKKRMKGTVAERWVRAKTGMLNGVTALGGYAGRKDGRVYTFAFIHNGSRDESRIRALFDDWLVRLLE